MTEIVVKFHVKDFNADLLRLELDGTGVPAYGGPSWRGFELNRTSELYEPIPERKVVATHTGLPDTFAEPGELHFQFRNPLTGPEDAALVGVLNAHDATVRTPNQQRETQDEADLVELLSDYLAWDGLNNQAKFVVLKRLLRVVIRELDSDAAI